jgi:cytidylate kinase
MAPIFVITGIMAAGKSTVAEALALRLPRAAHVRGDAFRRMIVSGRAEMSPPLSADASAQLQLRQQLAVTVAETYAAAGIAAILQDLYLGSDFERVLSSISHRPLFAVVLAPRPDVVARREAERAKSGYDGWTVKEFDSELRRSAPRGLWLDTSELSVEQTVDEILARREQASID